MPNKPIDLTGFRKEDLEVLRLVGKSSGRSFPGNGRGKEGAGSGVFPILLFSQRSGNVPKNSPLLWGKLAQNGKQLDLKLVALI